MSDENLFMSTTFYSDNSKLEDVLALCKKNNISRVELGSNHQYQQDFIGTIKKFNFKYLVHNYFPIPKNPFVLNIASNDKEINKRSLQHIKRAIDFCSEINAPLYTFHPGFLADPKGSNLSQSNYDFNWSYSKLKSGNYDKAFERMTGNISEIITYAKSKNVKIAIETEGSYLKKDYLLMQYPDEFQNFFRYFSPSDIGINLNIGHLLLASNAFIFKIPDFIDLIQSYVVAMELSHNDGVTDDHKPLKENEWYWKIIFDLRFSDAYKILEFRNVNMDTIQKNIELYHHHIPK